jgi:prolyl-tRNA editing enzyme YbaK/EbsC (Cys-tRNA(Pro) deacylase)
MTSHEAPPSKTGSKERVERFLAELSLQEGIVHFDQSTKTAQMAADAVGCELGQIVKSLVFVVDDQPTLALVAGDRRGDTEVIASEIGGIKAEFQTKCARRPGMRSAVSLRSTCPWTCLC